MGLNITIITRKRGYHVLGYELTMFSKPNLRSNHFLGRVTSFSPILRVHLTTPTMSTSYQRQFGGGGGKKSKPNIYGASGGTSPTKNDAASRAEKQRQLRQLRLKKLREEATLLDEKFGYINYDYKLVQDMKDKLSKIERREMLVRQMSSTAGNGGGEEGINSQDGASKKDGACEITNNDAVMKQVQDDTTLLTDGTSTNSNTIASMPGVNGSRRGWIFNMSVTTLPATNNDINDGSLSKPIDTKESGGGFVGAGDEDGGGGGESQNERSGVELFLIDDENRKFKSTVVYEPYFYLIPDDKGLVNSMGGSGGTNTTNMEELHSLDQQELQSHYQELLSSINRHYQSKGLTKVEIVRKMDLDAPNHLGTHSQTLGGRPMLKLIFDNVDQLQRVKKEVMEVLEQNKLKKDSMGDQFEFATYNANYQHNEQEAITETKTDPMEQLLDIREHDVPYLVRVCIDLNLRAGCWYTVTPISSGGVTISDRDNLQKANPTVLAFDIECTKAPLKFPDANVDSIFMISYMINGQGYLLLSRHVVGKDVPNFEYTPKPKYPGPFIVINELTEEALIRRFLVEFVKAAPQIVVTYNGDFFDWPFLEKRAAVYGLDLRREIGFYNAAASGGDSVVGNESSEYRGRTSVHLDAFCWVKRDSYLPQGSQGLKAVTKYKLGYDPVEVDPEDMVRYARDRPAHMASYSVSDAVATYYLYDKYVHMFIFSLCTIIPMGPEDVLRKGSGTLCEALLMVEACTKSIICPNKERDPVAKFTPRGNLLESETYIGGKVECLETGVYRSDIEYKFDMNPDGFQGLINNVDRDMTFAIEVEGGIDRRKITNYDEVSLILVT